MARQRTKTPAELDMQRERLWQRMGRMPTPGSADYDRWRRRTNAIDSAFMKVEGNMRKAFRGRLGGRSIDPFDDNYSSTKAREFGNHRFGSRQRRGLESVSG